MKHFVSINETEIEFFTDENATILEQAELNGYTLKYGCRLGVCRVCKLRLLTGEIEYAKGTKIGLTEEELNDNYFLPCCSIAKSNIVCNSVNNNKIFLSNKKEGAVICFIERALDITILRFKLSKTSRINFTPGQYIGIEIPNGKYRFYSVANIPKNDGYIEIHVAKNENGIFSDLMCEKLVLNDVLWIYGPYGDILSEIHHDSRDIICIATGTGFAPLKSIIESGIFNDRKIYLIWGGRKKEDYYFSDIIDSWKNTLKNFHFHMILSRQNEINYPGSRVGYVQDIFRQEINCNDKIEVFMCGSPKMINDMFTLLKDDYHLHRNYIHADVFYPNN
jgi:NAD(P)H-flavin reductase/ferredoxin